MGINKLLPQLYGGRMEDQQTGFAGLEDLRNKKNGASIDTGTLIFVCALNHKSSCILATIDRRWQSFNVG